jgi:hypothetical protein
VSTIAGRDGSGASPARRSESSCGGRPIEASSRTIAGARSGWRGTRIKRAEPSARADASASKRSSGSCVLPATTTFWPGARTEKARELLARLDRFGA